MPPGANDLKAAHGFARRLSNAQLKELGCPKAKDALGNEVWGKYVCPSYNAFYHLLRHKVSALGPSGWQCGKSFSEVQCRNRIEAVSQKKTP